MPVSGTGRRRALRARQPGGVRQRRSARPERRSTTPRPTTSTSRASTRAGRDRSATPRRPKTASRSSRTTRSWSARNQAARRRRLRLRRERSRASLRDQGRRDLRHVLRGARLERHGQDRTGNGARTERPVHARPEPGARPRDGERVRRDLRQGSGRGQGGRGRLPHALHGRGDARREQDRARRLCDLEPTASRGRSEASSLDPSLSAYASDESGVEASGHADRRLDVPCLDERRRPRAAERAVITPRLRSRLRCLPSRGFRAAGRRTS